MAQFSSVQGDIWSIGGISFASPVNDILDREIFTIEELLQEDEILQEVKAKNERLIQFIVQESSLKQMIDYITTSPDPAAGDTRVFKLPYMSCEIFCCEIPELLNYLANDTNNVILRRLFTILDSDGALDKYLAGYFEKILEMLFRRMTIPIMNLINTEGASLLNKFLFHIENYSVMQVVQRLLLPHIPFSIPAADSEPPTKEEAELMSCNWSYYPWTCQLLCDKMLSKTTNTDVSTHVSDLLITVIQLSHLDAAFLSHLCESPCLSKLVSQAFTPNSVQMNKIYDPLSLEASIGLACISVLESLVSKLGEHSLSDQIAQHEQQSTGETSYVGTIHDNSVNLTAFILPTMFIVNTQLRDQIERASSHILPIQNKTSVPRLGYRSLQLVKLVESLIRIDMVDVDTVIVKSDVLMACVDLMFTYEMNSLLQLSVQRIITLLMEGGHRKELAQRYLLQECNLLPRIMSNVVKLESNGRMRAPVIGHLIQIANTINAVCSPAPPSVEALSVDSPTTSAVSIKKTEEKPSLLALLEKQSCYAQWKTFLAQTISPILAVQTTVHTIIDAATASKMTSAANQSFGMAFSSERGKEGAGFFDEDEDDDDIEEEGVDLAMAQAAANFAHFEAFPAFVSSAEPTRATAHAADAAFSFQAFDDPNLFASVPAVMSKPSSAFSSTVSKDLGKDIFGSSSISSVFDLDFGAEESASSKSSK